MSRVRRGQVGLALVLAVLGTPGTPGVLGAGHPMHGEQMPRAYDVRPTSVDDDLLLAGTPARWREAESIAWGPEPYPTTFQALWTGDALYVRFVAVDDDPWSTMTERDDPLWDEEVVEIFLDLDRSGTHYAEVEISPANVVCDVRMVRPSPDKEMDLSWDLEGLQTRVHLGEVDGRAAWVATARMPWSGFRSLPSATGRSLPPVDGDRWRFNVFRIKRPGGAAEPTRDVIFAAWSDPGEPSFHVPAAFRDLHFVGQGGVR